MSKHELLDFLNWYKVTLKDDWDGQGAEKPSESAYLQMEDILFLLNREPSLVPSPSGGMSLIWYDGIQRKLIEFECNNDGTIDMIMFGFASKSKVVRNDS